MKALGVRGSWRGSEAWHHEKTGETTVEDKTLYSAETQTGKRGQDEKTTAKDRSICP